MWLAVPWSKSAKWWVTGLGLSLAVLGIIISFFLMISAVSPAKQLNRVVDQRAKANVQEIARKASSFCTEEGVCAASIAELQQKSFLSPSLDTSAITYSQVNGGKDCLVQTTLSTSEVYSVKCVE